MKATGIVRRIDDLGRVVIPKEIRRTMRIREGDPLEIYTEKDGEVIFKKYSPMGGLTDFAYQMCETLNSTSDCICAIADRDSIIAVSGAPRREFVDKRLSSMLEQIMEGRQTYQRRSTEKGVKISEDIEDYEASVAAPIISEGDLMGCVLFVTPVGAPALGDTENKLACTVAGFLGKQLEA